ncbi:MAG: AbrB/MazE/SpoVT family DNA-binding domain-containing protein [Novosphingobium sp.]
MKMQIGKGGNSLAVRLPAELVEKYGLKEGDSLDIEAALAQTHETIRQERRQAALEKIRAGRYTLPADWKMTREEMNWRPALDKW